jgi:predicted permease
MKIPWFHRRREADLDAEIRGHLNEAIRDHIERGETPEQARATALREFGNIGMVKEVTREMWGWALAESLLQDLRFVLRSLWKHALLSLAVVATLTLGIGVSTGVFTWFNAMFLRARVDNDHNSFVQVYAAYTDDPTRVGIPGKIAWKDYLAFRDGAESLHTLTAFGAVSAPFGQDDPAVTRAALVTCNFFSLYDPGPPLLGRLLQPEDCAAANPVVVLSERLWSLRFGSDPMVVSRVAHFNGQPITIVGVTRNFAGMVNGARAWFPVSLGDYLKVSDHLQHRRETPWFDVTGRLQLGRSREQAAAELDLLARGQNGLRPLRSAKIFVTNGSEIQEPSQGSQTAGALALILGALTVFVLIVCVNVTTLLLARAASRQQEIAVRLALGAGRLRLMRMLLVETFLLAAAASLASVFLAYRFPVYLEHWRTNPRGEPAWFSLSPDWRVFGYLTLTTMLAGALAGLTPALQSLKVNVSEALKGRSSLPSGGGLRLYSVLIGAQLTLSLFLLTIAALFLRTSQTAVNFEPGFEMRNVLAAQTHPPAQISQPMWGTFHRALTQQLTNLPGVQSVAWASWSPVYVGMGGMNVRAPGKSLRHAAVNTVSAGYFETLGIPLLGGRAIGENDRPCDKGPCSVVVSERFAQSFWPNDQPLGKTFQSEQGEAYEVVGVVRDVSSTRLGGLDDPMFYRSWNPNGDAPANAFVRFAGSEAAITRAVLVAYRTHAPDLPVEAMTLQSLRENNLEGLRRLTQLVVLLCVLALILTVVSLYGVVNFAVNRRAKEIGIRLALGARATDIYRGVLYSGGRPIAVGFVTGFALTAAVFFPLSQLLQRNPEVAVNVWDPFIFMSAAALLIVAALAAMLGPARRATQVDPLIALRQE